MWPRALNQKTPVYIGRHTTLSGFQAELEVFPQLLRDLESPDVKVRRKAAEALTYDRDYSLAAIPALTRALDDSRPPDIG